MGKHTAAKAVLPTQAQQEECLAVMVKALRVLIIPDGTGWFAQGLEIDYSAGGNSLEDVKRRFQEGLSATIQEHVRVFGSVDKLIKAAPAEDWAMYSSNNDKFALSLVTFCPNVNHDPINWPYPEIIYLQQRKEQLAYA